MNWEYEDQNDEQNIYTFCNDEGQTLTEYRNEGRYTITGRFGKIIEEGVL